jgi:agmatine deiminase
MRYIFTLVMLFVNMIFLNAQNLKFKGHHTLAKTAKEKELSLARKQTSSFQSLGKAFPTDIILPGEFEESQAVAISWSFEYDNNGNVIGADTTSIYGYVSAQLAYYIQQECKVYIRVNAAADTIAVKAFMISLDAPLTNYEFIVSAGEDWWTRDYGPMAFYYHNLDSIGFADMKYYDGRDNDNLFPSVLANKMKLANFETPLNAEGGNLMTDGFGRLVYSDIIGQANKDALGWTVAKSEETLKNIFGTQELIELKTLQCDGGTGHIDLYTKFIDEQTLLVAQYPNEVTAQDKQIIEDNYQALTNLKSTYNRPFRIIRVEHPTNDSGTYTDITCDQINNDARNFINGLTVNNMFIFPDYFDGYTGNKEQDDRVIAFLEKTMPGYKIIPIDSRDLSPLGGAIHCITMQIPATNPLRIWHPSVDGIQPNLNKFHIVSKITTPSGVATAKCIWKKNKGAWTTINLTDSAGFWVGDIDNPGLQGTDYIEYYIEAVSNNGKKGTKPYTAANGGYFKIKLMEITGIDDALVTKKNHLFTAYPNPASGLVNFNYQLLKDANVKLSIFDYNGKEIWTLENSSVPAGLHTQTVNIEQIPAGLYLYSIQIDNQTRLTKKMRIE